MEVKKHTSADVRKLSLIARFLLIITLLSVIFALWPFHPIGHSRAQTGTWFDPNWQYRQAVTIDNSSNANNLTNYQVAVSLSSTNFDFTKAQTNGTDLRFTDTDGITPINYWIEKFDFDKSNCNNLGECTNSTRSRNAKNYIYVFCVSQCLLCV